MAKNQERTKAALVKRLSEVRIVEIACKSVGISRATYYRWLREDQNFGYDCEDAIQQGTDTISDLAESQIVSKIKVGELRAATYWLEHHHRDYKPIPKPVKSGSPRTQSGFADGKLTDGEFDVLMNAMEALKEDRDLKRVEPDD
jgi:hypothetical protein